MGTFIRSDFNTSDSTAPRITQVYGRDTFNRADSATPGKLEVGGHTWRVTRPNTWNIKSGVLESGDTTGGVPNDCWINPGATDGILTATVLAGGQFGMASLLFRRGADTDTAWVYYARSDTHTLAIRNSADNFTAIAATGPNPGLRAGEQIKVEMIGNRIICSVDGVVTHDVTNNTHLGQTGVGVHTRLATAASPAKFDAWAFSAR